MTQKAVKFSGQGSTARLRRFRPTREGSHVNLRQIKPATNSWGGAIDEHFLPQILCRRETRDFASGSLADASVLGQGPMRDSPDRPKRRVVAWMLRSGGLTRAGKIQSDATAPFSVEFPR